MECVLADVLRDQRNLSNKGDGGWKRSALNVVAAVLSTSFNVNVTSDNVKNHIKLWRSWYGIVSDILGQSGFDWDSNFKNDFTFFHLKVDLLLQTII